MQIQICCLSWKNASFRLQLVHPFHSHGTDYQIKSVLTNKEKDMIQTMNIAGIPPQQQWATLIKNNCSRKLAKKYENIKFILNEQEKITIGLEALLLL